MAHTQTVELPRFDFNKLPRRRKLRAQTELLELRRNLRAKGLEARDIRHQVKWLRWQVAADSSLAEKFEVLSAIVKEMDRYFDEAKSAISEGLSLSAGANVREPNTAQPRQARRSATATRSGSDSDPPGLPTLGVHWTQTGLKLSDLTQASQFGGGA